MILFEDHSARFPIRRKVIEALKQSGNKKLEHVLVNVIKHQKEEMSQKQQQRGV